MQITSTAFQFYVTYSIEFISAFQKESFEARSETSCCLGFI